MDSRILKLIEKKPDITESEIASQLGITVDEVKQRMERFFPDTREKILIADDEKDAVDLLKMSLEDKYNTIGVYSGKDAIEKSRTEIPDLILLDLMFPDIDGFEVCSRLKNDPLTKNIPIIMLTGKNEAGNKIKGLDDGADDYVTKPFNINELKARIRTVLRRSKR